MLDAQASSVGDRSGPEPGPFLALVPGRYLLSDGEESACIARIRSADSVEIINPESGPRARAGMEVTCYLDSIGMVAGPVRHLTASGFVAGIEVNPARRARIESRLDWLRARAAGAAEQRSNPRIVPVRRGVTVRLADGQEVEASIVDLSMSGAALALAAQPDPGSLVTVGKRFASVARHTGDGIAVAFRLPLSAATFNEHVVL